MKTSYLLLLVGSFVLEIAADTASSQELVGPTHVWRYEQTSNLDGIPWEQPGYDDSAWPVGVPVFGVESNPAVPPITTPLSLGRITYYFRTHFTFSGNPNGVALLVTNLIDDAAAVYLNGNEVLRLRLPPGAVYATLATSAAPVSTDASDEVFLLCAPNLLVGDNVLAVEVHQVSATSSDIVFRATLYAVSPVITQEPADTTVLQCRTATFSVQVQGGSLFTYQWFRNGILVPGATSSTYTTPPVSFADNGAVYSVTISDACSTVTSRAALLTVVADTEPPVLVSVVADCENNQICVTYSEKVDGLTASDPFNYVVDGGMLTVFNAILQPDGKTVCLLLDPSQPLAAGTHTIEECNVADCAGNITCSSLPFACAGMTPTITCPDDIVQNNDAGLCSGVVTWVFPIANGPGVVCNPASGSTFPVGTTTVTCTTTDASGNSSSCSFSVTVIDHQPPMAVCQNVLVNLTAAGGTATLTPQAVDGGSSDNCGIVEWTLDRNTFSCCDVGTHSVTLTVKDAAGLSATCVAMVVVTLDTVTVSQNSTINFNTTPPTYTGDPSLAPFVAYDKSGGTTADKWKVIINVGSRKLLIKSGVFITTTMVPATSNNRKAPGIVILACQEEIEEGGGVVVTSVNQPAGDIFIQTTGQNLINGIVRNEVQGTLGRPGAISIASCCDDIVTGPASRIETIGVDPGGANINLVTCQSGGDIFLSGLVRAMHKMGTTPTINIASFAGTVTIDGNNDFGEETFNGGVVRTTSGVLVRTLNAASAGNIRIQAQGDLTVSGNRILNKNRTQYGAVAIKSLSSNGQNGSGLMDVRSIAGSINSTDRAFDFENRFNGLNQIQLLAADDILLEVTPLLNDGAADNTKAVVSTQGGSAGKGGVNVVRAYAGGIVVGANAQVLANFTGTPGTVGSNQFGSCAGNLILGAVNPAPAVSTPCAPPAPAPLFNGCGDFGLNCP